MATGAETTTANPDPAPAKKSRNNSRKALKQKNTNIVEHVEASPTSSTKESQPLPEPKKLAKGGGKAKQGKQQQSQSQAQSFEKDVQEMQEMFEKMKIEKEKTEELLKEKDEMLKKKEDELEMKGTEQEKLKMELKKLQKMKEFKPSLTLPFGQSVRDIDENKKGKKKKDGPVKKRPSTPYILWCKDQWNEVKKEHPEADFKQISNILGEKWKKVSAEEKKPYEERYQAEKEFYLKEVAKEKRETEAMKLLEVEHKQKIAMELYDQYLQFIQGKEMDAKKNKKEKDPLKPKQPISAFLLFSNDRRATLLGENKNVVEAAKLTGEEWKNMTEEQKRPYEELARKNKEKYLQEMELYKQKKEEEALNYRREEEELMKLQREEAMQLLKKKEKTEAMIKRTKEEKKKKKNNKSKNVDPNKPKKPPSSFLLFSKETRKSLQEEQPGKDNASINAMISVKWKELSEEDRQVWNSKAAEAMEAYKKELEKYNKSIAPQT